MSEQGKYTDLARRFVEGIKSTGLFGRPYEETPIGIFGSMRGRPLEEQLKVSENDPAWGFAGTTIGKGIRAFHGSPHSFDKFDLSKIGTGEGAQAYGHGLYFAEAEDVARSYRDALAGSNTRWMLGDRVLSGAEQNAATLLDWASGNKDKALASLRLSRGTRTADQKYLDATEAALREMDPTQVKVVQDPGHMYEVNINASPDEFLDWDKPVIDQPESIKNPVLKLLGFDGVQMIDRGANFRAGSRFVAQMPNGRVIASSNSKQQFLDNVRERLSPTGQDVFGLLTPPSSQYGTPLRGPEYAQKLQDAGIAGIKYLDQGSRAAGDGSRNYVVFNPSLIEIMRKYGVLAPTATLGGMAYGTRNNQTGVQ